MNAGGIALLGEALEQTQGDQPNKFLRVALREVVEHESTALCGAAYGSRSEGRASQRNGYRERPLETRLGTQELQLPKLRRGSYLPSLLEPRRRWERAFVNAVWEA